MMKLKRSFALVAASVLLALASAGCADASHDGVAAPSDPAGEVGTEATGSGLTLERAEEVGLFRTDWVVSVDAPAGVPLAAGEGPVTITFTVANVGENPDNYAIEGQSLDGLGFADFSGLPAEIALAPGESQEVTIEVTVPVGTADGVFETLVVSAESTVNGIASSSGAATVFVIAK